MEIDEYRDYEKALGALREAEVHLNKGGRVQGKDSKLALLQTRIAQVDARVTLTLTLRATLTLTGYPSGDPDPNPHHNPHPLPHPHPHPHPHPNPNPHPSPNPTVYPLTPGDVLLNLAAIDSNLVRAVRPGLPYPLTPNP